MAAEDWPDSRELPTAVQAVAIRLQSLTPGKGPLSGPVPRVRLRTRSGRWLILHASWLKGSGREAQVAVIIEAARPHEIAPAIAQAYGLSPREREVVQCVLQGWSTLEMSTALRISLNTVQDHLKKVFDKTGVSSRRELVARLFNSHYEPHIKAGARLDITGWFKPPRAGAGANTGEGLLPKN